jgi:GNAT superfamily N-acetyltransferase
MEEIVYRRLGREGTDRLGEIDRTELIDSVYYMRDGRLVLVPERRELHGWPPGYLEKEGILQPRIFERGGVIYGAFFGDRLVGYMSLDTKPICGRHDRLLLDMLHVDSSFRGRGVGCKLLEHAKSIAKEMGARSLYVCAIPSQHTVEFYRHRGFSLADELDPEQLADWPDDIHMVMEL